MSKLSTFLKFKGAGKHRESDIKERKFLHPSRDWLIGISIFTIIIFSGGVASAIFFVQFGSIIPTISESSVVLPRYNEPLIVDAVVLYKSRREEFDKLSQPSLFEGLAPDREVATSSEIFVTEVEPTEGITPPPEVIFDEDTQFQLGD